MQYIYKGQYNSFMFNIELADGTPYDLSDSTVKFIVKKAHDYEDETAVLTGSLENSETNNVMFDFTAGECANLIEGDYVMAIKIFKESGVNLEVWSDSCKIVKGVFDE